MRESHGEEGHREVIFGLGFEESVIVCKVEKASEVSQLEKQFTE